MASWSSDDKKTLRENYPTTSAKELSDELGRSAKAIHSKASRMGLQKEKSEERVSACDGCGDDYKHGGDNSWGHTSLCRACYDKQRRRNRKQRVVDELFDGECEYCGYNDCLKALTLHHQNPENKEIRMADMLRHSWDTVVDEANKCSLLCANCHNKLHCDNCVEVAE